ncbi:MAG: ABC transporter substrate-binding protein [Desulfobacca sp.]|uniref:ABC transporter substrate-binding protein n=1 Tax=Desulfobacca sp. TaxID=2067990 RepID=UPI00404A7430
MVQICTADATAKGPRRQGLPVFSALVAVSCCLAIILLCCRTDLARAAVTAIRLGEINPLTGNLALHGQEIHQGIEAAVAEANAKGGILGRPVELLSRDDQSRPDVALNQTQDLLHRQKVVGLLGGYVDSLVGPISSLAARQQTPYVAAASLQQALTAQKNPFFFRVSSMTGIIRPLERFLSEVVRPQTVALLYTATPGSTEFAASLRDLLSQRGIRVVVFEKFRPETPDFSMLLLKVREARAEVLISGGFFPDNLLLVRQLREQSLPLTACIAPWGVAYEKFLRELRQNSEGLVGMCAWNPGITYPGTEAASEAFVQTFQAKYGHLPNSTTMHGYAAAKVMLAAIAAVLQQGQALTGPAIAQELRRVDLLLPLGRIRFAENGDPLDYRQVMVQIQNGAFQVVYPPEQATGTFISPLPHSGQR